MVLIRMVLLETFQDFSFFAHDELAPSKQLMQSNPVKIAFIVLSLDRFN